MKVPAAFRRFETLSKAFDRHAELLTRPRVYAPAMHTVPDMAAFVRLITTHNSTDPDDAGKLLVVISGSELTRFDAAPSSTAPSGHEVLRASFP